MTKKAINLAAYQQLSPELQFDILHNDGAHIGKRVVNGQRVILFQLYSFYVEVYYKEYRREISHTITSESVDILQPYLDQIHIHPDGDSKGNR